MKRFKRASGVIGAAAAATEGSELWLGNVGKAVGLLLAQSTDDVMNAGLVPGTEEGGTKSKKQILKDSKLLVPILLGFGAADYTMIPHLLESPSLPIRIVGAFSFWTAAVGGSVGANTLHLYRTHKEKKKVDPEVPFKNRFKKSWEDHIFDPFRKNIWRWSVVSLGASMGAASTKVLIGKEWSGVLELGIGITESAPALFGIPLAKPYTNLKRGTKDLLLVKQSQEPIQIFPQAA